MKTKLTRLTSIFLAISILLSFNIFAGAVEENDTTETSENVVFDISIDLSEYSEFDINDYVQYIPLLEASNVNIDDVFAIIPLGEENSSNTRALAGGILVLTSTFASDGSFWILSVLNVGVIGVKSMSASVQIYNNTYGPVLNSTRNLGGLGIGGSVTESYSGGYHAFDCVIMTVTGYSNNYEFFSMEGVKYR